jgi:hypothetical protein
LNRDKRYVFKLRGIIGAFSAARQAAVSTVVIVASKVVESSNGRLT